MARLFKEVKILGLTQLPDRRETSPCLNSENPATKICIFLSGKNKLYEEKLREIFYYYVYHDIITLFDANEMET
jgi:hypothetical protein